MSQTFETKEGRAVQHLFVMDDICRFFKENGLLEKKSKLLPQMFESCYRFAYRHSPEYERAFVVATLIKLLRAWDIDCTDYWYLQDLKMGNYDISVGGVALGKLRRRKGLISSLKNKIKNFR